MKLRTKIMLLVCSVVIAILMLNQYPVSMSLKQAVTQAQTAALDDISYLLARAPSIVIGINTGDKGAIEPLVQQVEALDSCSGLAILDRDFHLVYKSTTDPIDPRILVQCQQALGNEVSWGVIPRAEDDTAVHAIYPVFDLEGTTLGYVIGKLQIQQDHAALQKAQRDLNAMTMLVMLIALIFVWDLTDNIKGTMFNLEPVEIVQLLVERNALIDAVRDGILSVDSAGAIIHLNATGQQLLQHSLPSFERGTSRFSRIFPHLPLCDILKSNQPLYDSECMIGRDDFYANFIPINIEKPQHQSLLITFRLKQEVVRFAEDITGVKSYVEALRGQMHEFNNKLQVISGLVQAKSYLELEDYIYTLVHLKNREMQQINQKISDPILAAFLMSKFDRAAEQKVDLVLTERSELHRPLSGNLVQDLVVVIGNLLENAFDAVQSCAMQTVTLELGERAGALHLCVWDSGISIPENIREQLFDYGVTTKKEGNGIGLFLVQQSIARYNGYISVTSDDQAGTEFTVHIPLIKEQEDADVHSLNCGR